MQEIWDKRYAGVGFTYGTAPADFLTDAADLIPTGARVLCVADGEGRNSVFLAGQGHQVTAFDISPVGLAKARALAADQGVEVGYHIADTDSWDWSQTYDAVVAIFIQFAPPAMRARIFDGLRRATRPGGLLLLHGFAPRQVGYGTGGPPSAENLYTEDLLRDTFGDWEVLRLVDYDADIEEGTGHSGRAALVDLIARRPMAP